MPALEIENLHVTYGQIKGTSGVSLDLEESDTLALIGSNGAGKSSTLRAIMGLAPYALGEIRCFGTSLKGKRPSDMVALGIGYAPEGRRVFTGLTVEENLRLGSYLRSRSEFATRVEQIFGYFPHLRERARQRAGTLSGGEQQMLAIGRALMSKPKVFLLDEPSLGLGPVVVETIGMIIREIQKAERITVVLAEQNANWALSVVSRAAILELGKIALQGTAAQVSADERVRSVYLGT